MTGRWLETPGGVAAALNRYDDIQKKAAKDAADRSPRSEVRILPDRPALAGDLEFAIGALRSNQDVLLNKVKRTPVVEAQLALNRDAIVTLKTALAKRGIVVN